MKEIPCKNCITLGMCKAQVNEFLKTNKDAIENQLSITYYIYNVILKDKCDLIFYWIDEYSGSAQDRTNRFIQIQNLFNC